VPAVPPDDKPASGHGPALYAASAAALAVGLVVVNAPGWIALGAGVVLALATGRPAPKHTKKATTYALQAGVVALGAGMDLAAVWHVGSSGALYTAVGLAVALALGLGIGRLLRVPGDTPLLIAVGTAICGGSAIAAVCSVIKPKEHEMSVALAVVFVLNAVGLVLFPILGHALGLSEDVFGRWCALAIHDTSSVVGAGKAYGEHALAIATTTKLARALWIVPVTIAIAVRHGSANSGTSSGASRFSRLAGVKWPWFILGFIAAAALRTWIPAFAEDVAPYVVDFGRRALVLALFLIGVGLSRAALGKVGARPLVLGVSLWIVVAVGSLALVTSTT
jgi:uncharacterized integral membrane protein (TIGR00698 family)